MTASESKTEPDDADHHPEESETAGPGIPCFLDLEEYGITAEAEVEGAVNDGGYRWRGAGQWAGTTGISMGGPRRPLNNALITSGSLASPRDRETRPVTRVSDPAKESARKCLARTARTWGRPPRKRWRETPRPGAIP